MSYMDGLSAINLEMPDRIPRTEYSAHTHWDLIKNITGIEANENSSIDDKQKAASALVKAWDYGMFWNIYLLDQPFGDYYTRMGHASYEAGGIDYSNKTYCPFKEVEDVLDFDPVNAYGIPDRKVMSDLFKKNYLEQDKAYPDTVNMTGIYITCMSGLIEIFGWDMLLTGLGVDPEAFGEMTNRYTNWLRHYFEALADTDVQTVMIHDDIVWTEGAFVKEEWYRKYVFPNYKKLFEPLIDAKKKILFTSDGNYTMFIDDIAKCNVNGFVMEPLTDMAYVAEKYGKTHSIVGNADTRILLSGSRDQIYSEVKRCMDIGKDCPGFFMAVGNHIPSNTPVENALYYNECYEKMRRR